MTDTTLTMNLGKHNDSVKRVIDAMAANYVISRIWAKDHTLWKPDPTEIADRLSISRRTVEMHRGNMMRKLELNTQTDLIRYALKRGILPIETSDELT